MYHQWTSWIYSDASGLNLGSASADASVATIIQPRTPAPEYGPPKH